MTTVKLGSVYFGETASVPGFSACDSTLVSLGDTIPGMELEWVKYNNLLISTNCVCVDISWNTLCRLGYVFGHPVRIDGESYLCRCPELGSTEGDPTEWDDILAATTGDPDFWHCGHQWSWGKDTPEDMPSHRRIRGFHSPWNSASSAPENHTTMLGFRPILEPLPSIPSNLSTLIGKRIFISGPQGMTIGGKLVEFDEYDLLLENVASLHMKCDWVSQHNKSTTVARSAVLWLTKTKRPPG